MPKYISDSIWSNYQAIVEDFIDQDAGLQTVTWKRRLHWQNNYGEDGEIQYTDIDIKVLAQYNFFRTWPINLPTQSGEKEKTSFAVYFTKKQLEGIPNALDANGYFSFDTSLDRFILDGKWYIAKGDTKVAQAKDQAFLFEVILERLNEDKDI